MHRRRTSTTTTSGVCRVQNEEHGDSLRRSRVAASQARCRGVCYAGVGQPGEAKSRVPPSCRACRAQDGAGKLVVGSGWDGTDGAVWKFGDTRTNNSQPCTAIDRPVYMYCYTFDAPHRLHTSNCIVLADGTNQVVNHRSIFV